MNVLDLFSGIGGFSLGLERAGMRTIAFCEIDPYCRRVLAKHWPDVPIYGDIRELTAAQVLADTTGVRCNGHQAFTGGVGESENRGGRMFQPAGTRIDVICGGFPCQDISVAGKGAGIEGERSGLWSEYARIIGEVRPRYVIVENVAALLGRGLDRVLGDLAALGFDAEWHCIPASAVGAPHRRDRLWIVAHSVCLSERGSAGWRETIGGRSCDDLEGSSHHPVKVADAEGGRQREGRSGRSSGVGQGLREQALSDADSAGCLEQWRGLPIREELVAAQCGGGWQPESGFCRVAHGVPARVDRLRALGNAVVPQIPEIIGRAIMRAEA